MSRGGDLLRVGASGVTLRVRVTPRSATDAVEGLKPTADGPALMVRVRAVPAEGAANAAVEAVLARWLGVAAGTVSVAGGHSSRVKTLAVAGDPEALAARIADALAGLPGARR